MVKSLVAKVLCTVLIYGLIASQVTAVDFAKKPALNIAIIGAGVSGLSSARRSIEYGYNVTIYEQTGELGGIWVFTNKTGKDEYGQRIHSPMYQGLRTNQPHQIMEFPDHHYPSFTIPFPAQPDVLKYIQSFADRFDLKKLIRFHHVVVRVAPIEDDKWEIIVKNLPSNTYETRIFDAVFVTTGQFTQPNIPKFPGANEFKGKLLHSHEYRSAEKYQGQHVLVIGGGPSGRDLATLMSKFAKNITFSQHKWPNESKEKREKRQKQLPPNVLLQDNVKYFTRSGATFIDGSHQAFDTVFCATGYKISYSCLNVDSGISVDSNFVQPLYKQTLNIEHPSMAIIGLPYTLPTTLTYDMQVQFALKFISGAKKLPPKEDMMNDMRVQTQIHWSKGYTKSQSHYVAFEFREYIKQLTDVGDLKPLPDVVSAIFFDVLLSQDRIPYEFRKYNYTVINDKHFTKERYED